MDVRIQYINVLRPNTVQLQWTLIDPEIDRLAGSTYVVARSGSSEGEWSTVVSGLDAVIYRDVLGNGPGDLEEINHLSLQREMWYRVTLRLSDGTEYHSEPFNTDGYGVTSYPEYDGIGVSPQDAQTLPLSPTTPFQANPEFRRRLVLIQRSVKRNAHIALQHFTGVSVWVLKRKHFGERCSACYNSLLRTVVFENCSVCYGTGFVGGYYAPVEALAKITEAPPQQRFSGTGNAELVMGQIEMADFPRIEQDDIVVEKNNRHRWVVRDSVREANLRRTPVTQHYRCSALPAKDPAFSVPVDEDPRLP